VALGSSAGLAITTGIENVAIGYESLKNEDAHGRNTAVGTQALFSQNAGADAYNVAVGFQAGAAISTGACNVVVGSLALDANTTGVQNTAVGYQSLTVSTTGGNNTAFGSYSGDSVTTGINNTLIGFNGGHTVTTGDNNTLIGNLAGTDAVRTVTTGDNNIVIGNNSSATAHIKIDWTVTSDLRDKTEIKDVKHGLDFVNQITPIEYKFKKSREDDTPHGLTKYGFKAQEILKLEGDNPVIINNEDIDNLKLTNSHAGNMLPVLVNAIKELKAEIELLKNK